MQWNNLLDILTYASNIEQLDLLVIPWINVFKIKSQDNKIQSSWCDLRTFAALEMLIYRSRVKHIHVSIYLGCHFVLASLCWYVLSPTTIIHHTHYNDVIMTTIASQITSLMAVYSTVYSDANQRKHQSSASLAFVWGSHRDRWIPRTKGQLRGKCFHLMTSSWPADRWRLIQNIG